MACTMCDLPMADGEPTMTLMCECKFHTLCFVRFYATTNLSDTGCRTCGSYVVPRDILEEAEAFVNPENKSEIIKFLWETDPDFKNDLKTLHSLKTEQKKSATVCYKKQREILLKQNEEIGSIVNLLKDVVKKYKKEYKKSEEYLATRKIGIKHSIAKDKFRKRWGVRIWELRDTLKTIPDAVKYSNMGDYIHLWHSRDYLFNIRIK